MRLKILGASMVLLACTPCIAAGQSAAVRGWMLDDDTAGATFGYIQGVATDSRGRTYVLDAGQSALLVFDSVGRIVGRGGRAGFGPGEFSSPRVLLVDSRDRVLVLDSRQRRLSEYGWRGESFVHVRDQTLARDAYGACVRGDSLFTVGRGSESIISLYVRTGAEEYRAAASYGTLRSRSQDLSHPILRALRSQALLACATGSAVVVAVAVQVGEMQVFRALGEVGSLVTLEGFSGIQMIVGETSVENRLPESGVADATEATVLADSATLLLSYGEITGAAANRNLLRGFRLVQSDMQGRVISQRRSPWALGHVGARGVACYRNDPAPAVKVVFGERVSLSECDALVARAPAARTLVR
jgi:hypothetical protein